MYFLIKEIDVSVLDNEMIEEEAYRIARPMFPRAPSGRREGNESTSSAARGFEMRVESVLGHECEQSSDEVSDTALAAACDEFHNRNHDDAPKAEDSNP